MKPIEIFGLSLSPLIVLPAVYLTWLVIFWAIKRVVFHWLNRLSARTATRIDDIFVGAADAPVTLMILVWGLTATLHIAGAAIDKRWAAGALAASKIITLLAAILFADRLLINAFHVASDRFERLKFSRAFGGVLVHVAVFCVGGLTLLDSLGVSITPIIASLGIGSLAVALALQPTLENVFSGFQLLVDQPIKPGHYIKLDTGEEGFVDHVGWRTTWVRQGLNNMIIVPNKSLVNARIINFDYPSPDMIVIVTMGVHYGSDLEKVERVTVEVATEVMKRVPGAVPDHVPVIRFNKFNASSIDFVAVLKAKSFPDHGLVIHEFIKAVTARYAKENIVMPYPITAVNTSQEAAIFRRN